MEYKSENDTLNEDTYFKVMAYAYLYKSSEKHIGDIDINSVTVTFVISKSSVFSTTSRSMSNGFRLSGYSL